MKIYSGQWMTKVYEGPNSVNTSAFGMYGCSKGYITASENSSREMEIQIHTKRDRVTADTTFTLPSSSVNISITVLVATDVNVLGIEPGDLTVFVFSDSGPGVAINSAGNWTSYTYAGPQKNGLLIFAILYQKSMSAISETNTSIAKLDTNNIQIQKTSGSTLRLRIGTSTVSPVTSQFCIFEIPRIDLSKSITEVQANLNDTNAVVGTMQNSIAQIQLSAYQNFISR